MKRKNEGEREGKGKEGRMKGGKERGDQAGSCTCVTQDTENIPGPSKNQVCGLHLLHSWLAVTSS